MNNILTHNNKSKQAHQIATKLPVQERLLRALLTWTFTRNAPYTDCAGGIHYYISKIYIRKCT